MTPDAPTVATSYRERGRLVLRIRVPKHPRSRARYVSPATKSMTIALDGPSKVNDTIQLAPGSNTFSVALAPCPTAAACYTGTIATYDAHARVLSSNQRIAFAITAGSNNSIAVTLDGIAASLTLTPTGASSLQGSDAAGFSISKCVTVAQAVALAAYDADGEQILGAGAPTLSLTSNDALHLPASAVSGGGYSLVPPKSLLAATIPNAHTVVALTEAATAPVGGGIATVTRKIDVTFDGTVCGVVTPYTVSGFPNGIAAGPDGAMWFTEPFQNRVMRMTIPTPNPSSSATPMPSIGIYPLTASSGASPNPQFIATGADGKLWMTDHLRNSIWRMTTAGSANEYSNPSAKMILDRIAGAANGSLWFAQRPNVGAMPEGGIVNVATSGTFSTPLIVDGGDNGVPGQLITGPDGNEWFSNDGFPPSIDKVNDGAVVVYPMPAGTPAAHPGGIATGSDGGVWFTDFAGSRIFRMNTKGAITNTYALPAGTDPGAMVAGPDGALYFLAGLPPNGAGIAVGRMTTAGTLTSISFPGTASTAIGLDIAVGPDGAIWVAEEANDFIVRIQ
jgi:virginiamycin B lyase